MCMKCYQAVSGTVFGLVAVGHVVRLSRNLPVQIGEWSVPMGVSWGGLIATGLLSVWAFSALCPRCECSNVAESE
jgi:hypothetical protein